MRLLGFAIAILGYVIGAVGFVVMLPGAIALEIGEVARARRRREAGVTRRQLVRVQRAQAAEARRYCSPRAHSEEDGSATDPVESRALPRAANIPTGSPTRRAGSSAPGSPPVL